MHRPLSAKVNRFTSISDTSCLACDFVAAQTGLSKARVKDAMNKGALWLTRKGQSRFRLRKATFLIQKGDTLDFYYDEKVLSAQVQQASCLSDYNHYSLWLKPAGLLTQGTDYGDSGSLLRQVELFFKLRRDVYPVHRLDREVAGIILVAHSKKAAAKLSRLFQEHQVVKRYHAEVLGLPPEDEGVIREPLDDKEALTRYRVISRNTDANTSILDVQIETGRIHQIRRHLAGAGHPVMGDPRYGTGNRDGRPMRLCACELSWRCPFTGKIEHHRLPEKPVSKRECAAV